jgi:hypothetical protein
LDISVLTTSTTLSIIKNWAVRLIFVIYKVTALDIINTMPKEDLVIIYGENDIHLFDGEAIKKLKERGFRIEEIKGSGHNYEENIEKAVLEAIS